MPSRRLSVSSPYPGADYQLLLRRKRAGQTGRVWRGGRSAHDDPPAQARPTRLDADFGADPTWQASAANSDASRYPHLLRPEQKHPNNNKNKNKAKKQSGDPVTIGSSVALLRELQQLNAR